MAKPVLLLESDAVNKLARLIEESTRASSDTAKQFLEPTPGVLSKAMSKRHHIVFGRRGSGKSSLLRKVAADLTVSRTPIAYVDLEIFKGHSYPDVLLSILLKTFIETKKWLDTAATNPANKTSFWRALFGSVPTKGAFNRKKTEDLSRKFDEIIRELNDLLHAPETSTQKDTQKQGGSQETAGKLGAGGAIAGVSAEASHKQGQTSQVESESQYTSKKIEALHRNIMRYQSLFQELSELASGPSFLLLDDLYHIRLADQAEVIDYFHRIAKGANLWLKIGTIRYRSRWYYLGDPSKGMKLGDDADEIDLDVTLDKYELTKSFLIKVLTQLSRESGVAINELLATGAKERLVLASGGVARDFLTTFGRAIEVAKERIASDSLFRGTKIGSEDVNVAAGELVAFKEEDFSRDTGGPEDKQRLEVEFKKVLDFCIDVSKANCFLVEKDIDAARGAFINQLVDLKFLHRVKSRVTVRDKKGRVYDALMLDLSRYTGSRARRDLEMVKFWGANIDALRRAKLIYLERD